MQTTPSLEEAKEYIHSIDFTKIVNKMVKQQGWLRNHALTVCRMYKNFLYLNKKYRSQYNLPPTDEIDEFWHMHILDTKQYRRDCEAIFGEYLDHYPYFGIDETTNFDDLSTAFEKMLGLYEKEFEGEKLIQVRGLYSKTISFMKMKFVKKPSRAMA